MSSLSKISLLASSSLSAFVRRQALPAATQARWMSVDAADLIRTQRQETDEEFDARYVTFFNRKDIDGWEIRRAFGNLAALDLIPEPAIVIAALKACRRVNDFSLTTRILETTIMKCGDRKDEVWPYLLQEIRPTLDELGINTPEELGYDQPELALPSPYEIH